MNFTMLAILVIFSGYFSDFLVHTYSLECHKCVDTDFQHGISVKEWSLVHPNGTGNRFFYCTEHKTERLLKYVLYIFIKVHSQMLMRISMLTVQINIYSFIVTSNKNIHACIQFNVHSGSTGVFLSVTVPFLFCSDCPKIIYCLY